MSTVIMAMAVVFRRSGMVPCIVVELPSQAFQSLSESFGIAVIKEIRIAFVCRPDPPRVFDRTPVLLGPRRYLSGVGRDAITV